MQPNVLTMESCSDSFSMVLVQPEDEHKRMESMNGASLVDITQKHKSKVLSSGQAYYVFMSVCLLILYWPHSSIIEATS